MSSAPNPTIARVWRGRTRRAVADEYQRYNYEAGVKPLVASALGVQSLREDRGDKTEFITSFWENIEAMARFAGAGSDFTGVRMRRSCRFFVPSTVT